MKYKENEDHSIDKLFAQKLGNLEGSPSANAWQALEKGLSGKARKKNRVALWLPYASAAAIVLLLVSIWLFRQQLSGDATTTGLADNTQTEGKKNQGNQPASQNISQTQDTAEASLPDQTTSKGQLAIGEQPVKKEDKTQQTKQLEQVQEQSNNRGEYKQAPAVKAVPEKPVQEKLPKPAVAPLENTIAQLKKQTPVVTPSSLTSTESTTIVVTVQLDEEADIAGVLEEETEEQEIEEVEPTEQAQKQSKAGKFFSTLKKIKKGDFNELGIKPEAIVAYVKDRAATNNQSNEK